MKEHIYVLYDKGAQMALKPFMVSRNDTVPVRELAEITANKDTPMHKHASEFELVQVATIDMETMHVEKTELRIVARCIDLLTDQDGNVTPIGAL
jgi:hypothetical protein